MVDIYLNILPVYHRQAANLENHFLSKELANVPLPLAPIAGLPPPFYR